MAQQFHYANNPQTVLSGSVTAGATSISVASAADFPTVGRFTIIVDAEIMLVTGVSGTTWTVTRGYDGTSAAAHNNNAAVVGILTRRSFLNVDRYDVRAYGAKGDGVADDTAAIQAAADDIALGFGGTGGVLYFPPGVYLISSPITVSTRGTRIQGSSAGYSSQIRPSAGFTGTAAIIFKAADNGLGVGYSVRDINVRMESVAAHGIVVYQLGDMGDLTNVWIDKVADGFSALRIIPNPDQANVISDTILLSNVYAVHASSTATGDLMYFEHCQEMTLVGVKARAATGNVYTGTAVPMKFVNCRSVALINCTTSYTTGNAIRVESNLANHGWMALYHHHFEEVGTSLSAKGNSAGNPLQNIYVRDNRNQGAVGGYVLANVTNSHIESGGKSVSLDVDCSGNTIITRSRAGVTDNGTNNIIIGYVDKKITVGGQNLSTTTLSTRVTAPSIAAGGSADVTITWPNGGFPGTSYTAVASLLGGFPAGSMIVSLNAHLAGSVVARVKNNDSVARSPVIHAIGIAD